MASVKKNIVANFAGNIWQALMGLVFIPLYIKFMGVESYGLIGIFATLQAMFSLLDMGLSTTLSREMARLSVKPGREQEMRNLARSLEVIYWCIAIFIGIAVMAISPFVSHQWVKAGQLSPQTIEQALLIMGFAMALQWPASLYSGGLMGLQSQVLLNVINIGMRTLRGVGAVLILWLISPTIQAFFSWQIIISIINTVLLASFLWQKLPRTEKRAVFQKELLIGVWRFAAGMSGITILVTILTQVDKIILSKMLPLEMFGYYTLAGVVAMALYRVIGPVVSAVYPRLTQLVSLGDQEELKRLYHKSCQVMSVLILPAAAVVALFSYEILLLWTQNPLTAKNTHLLVSILIIGTALNGLMNLPSALQLAYGWTRLGLYTNFISVIILVPLIIVMTELYGASGAASVWVVLNSGYVLIAAQILHRRLLPAEKWRWYAEDITMPLAAAFLTAGAGRMLFCYVPFTQPMMLLSIFIVSCFTLAITALAAPLMRSWVFAQLTRLKLSYGN